VQHQPQLSINSASINLSSINFASSMPIVDSNGASTGFASNGAAGNKSNGSAGVRRMQVQVSDKFGPTVNSTKFGGGGLATTGYTQSTFSTRGETQQKSCGTFLDCFWLNPSILL